MIFWFYEIVSFRFLSLVRSLSRCRCIFRTTWGGEEVTRIHFVDGPMTEECCICLESMGGEGVDIAVLYCKHRFHTECIQGVILANQYPWRADRCPLCRAIIRVHEKSAVKLRRKKHESFGDNTFVLIRWLMVIVPIVMVASFIFGITPEEGGPARELPFWKNANRYTDIIVNACIDSFVLILIGLLTWWCCCWWWRCWCWLDRLEAAMMDSLNQFDGTVMNWLDDMYFSPAYRA